MISEQSLKDKIHTIAKENSVPFNVCWKELLLERFLARLSISTYTSKFIFKGGYLLSYFMEIGRETVDLDFLLTKMNAEKDSLRLIFEEIASIILVDGFLFSLHSIEFLNHPHMEYSGYRIILNASFFKMKDKIQIDVGMGDVVDPLSYEIHLTHCRGKPFFENTISLLVYPPEAIFAEKLETILFKGPSNSRMKDYHDILLLIRNRDNMLNFEKLKNTTLKTFANRRTVFQLIKFDTSFMERLWTSHLRTLGDHIEKLNLPRKISDVVKEINQYVSELSITHIAPLVYTTRD